MSELKKTITAGCAQTHPVFGDTRSNLSEAISHISEHDLDLLVFPELALSGYEFINRNESLDLALDCVKGAEIQSLKECAQDTKTNVIIGLPEREGKRVYNSSALIQPDGSITMYRKIHLFDREQNLFDAGDKGVAVVETNVGRLGMMICFDWIFPETARLLALKGAQIICHPSNLVLSFCQRSMFARSVENGVFSMTCNRIGSEARTDRELTFTGSSQILSNRGAVLAQAEPDKTGVISAEFDPADADNKKITSLNHLIEDRRTEFYQDLVR